jgi:long-chain acyl-CoA synthetase
MPKKTIWTPTNLADMFLTSSGVHASREALKYKSGHHYETLTYAKLKEEVFSLAQSLSLLGLKKGDRAMIISENRPEWVITDLAFMLLGIVNVPVHSVLSTGQISEIIAETQPVCLFYSDKKVEDKLLELSAQTVHIAHLVSYEVLADSTHAKRLISFQDIIRQELTESDKARLVEQALTIKPEDLASIIYTSGTEGHLKGVRLSHANFIQNILGTMDIVTIYPDDKFFSILPLSHVFERAAGYYIAIYAGASVGFCLDQANFSKEIKERRPTVVLAVPRLFEKIYEKVNESVSSSPVKKLIFSLAFKHRKKTGLLADFYDKTVFSKIRNEFGGEIRFFVSGGAALPKKIGLFFAKAGLTIVEGYGLTETASVLSGNGPSFNKFGTVGKVAFNLTAKLADDGEILVRGPSVMLGYMREEDNKKAFTPDGYFKTGDLGEFDEDGYLMIKGRKKDLMVLTTGKKVAPVPIELVLEMSPYIEQAMVFGDARKHVGAVLLPNYDRLAKQFGISGKEKLRKNAEVQAFLIAETAKVTKHLSTIEHIRKFVTTTVPFTVENGQLTPTLKLRRHVILEEYASQIEEIYA